MSGASGDQEGPRPASDLPIAHWDALTCILCLRALTGTIFDLLRGTVCASTNLFIAVLASWQVCEEEKLPLMTHGPMLLECCDVDMM